MKNSKALEARPVWNFTQPSFKEAEILSYFEHILTLQ